MTGGSKRNFRVRKLSYFRFSLLDLGIKCPECGNSDEEMLYVVEDNGEVLLLCGKCCYTIPIEVMPHV